MKKILLLISILAMTSIATPGVAALGEILKNTCNEHKPLTRLFIGSCALSLWPLYFSPPTDIIVSRKYAEDNSNQLAQQYPKKSYLLWTKEWINEKAGNNLAAIDGHVAIKKGDDICEYRTVVRYSSWENRRSHIWHLVRLLFY